MRRGFPGARLAAALAWVMVSAPAWAGARGPAQGAPAALAALVEEAVAANPEIRAAARELESARAAVPQAGALDDPKIVVGVDNVPVKDPAFDRFLPTSKVLGLSQRLPFPGKLGLREDVARARARRLEALYRDKVRDVVRRVKESYYDLWFVDQALEINRRNRDLFRDLERSAAAKYSVGKGLQQDVLKAQVELSKILNELILLRKRRQTLAAALNELRDRPVTEAVPRPAGVVPAAFPWDLEELQAMAQENSLELRALDAAIKGRESAVALARRNFYPDMNVAVTYKQRVEGDTFPGDDWFSAFVTVDVPLYFRRRQVPALAQARADLARIRAVRDQVKNRLLFRVKEAYDALQQERERIELYRTGFLPQARQSLASAVSGYQVDKVDFLTLVDNQLTLLRFELAYAETVANYQKKIAALEALVDRDLVPREADKPPAEEGPAAEENP